MKRNVIDIGRYVRVSFDVLMAKLSPRAQQVWTLIASNGSPEKPEVWVRQPTVAEQLGCSTDTIGRALKELIRKGLIVETGRWHQGRYKVYRLNWNPPSPEEVEESRSAYVRTDLPPKRTPTFRSTAPSPSAKVEDHVPQKRGKLTRVPEKYEKNNSSHASEETPEERAWIIANIKLSRRETRRKKEEEEKHMARCTSAAARETQIPTTPEDAPVSRETNPILWAFLRIKWADAMAERVAA